MNPIKTEPISVEETTQSVPPTPEMPALESSNVNETGTAEMNLSVSTIEADSSVDSVSHEQIAKSMEEAFSKAGIEVMVTGLKVTKKRRAEDSDGEGLHMQELRRIINCDKTIEQKIQMLNKFVEIYKSSVNCAHCMSWGYLLETQVDDELTDQENLDELIETAKNMDVIARIIKYGRSTWELIFSDADKFDGLTREDQIDVFNRINALPQKMFDENNI